MAVPSIPANRPGGAPSGAGGTPWPPGLAAVLANTQENPSLAWQPGFFYQANVLVTNGGSTYICAAPHISSGTFSADSGFWTELGGGGGGGGAEALGYIDLSQPPYSVGPGGDLTTALQAAMTALATAGKSGTIFIPDQGEPYTLDGAQQTGGTGATAYSGQVVVPLVAYNGATPQITIRILGGTPAPQTYWGVTQPAPDSGTVVVSNAASGNIMDVHAGTITGLPQVFSCVTVLLENLVILCPNNPACGGLRLDRAFSAGIRSLMLGPNAAAATFPTNGTVGLWLPQTNNAAGVYVRDTCIYGFGTGLRHADHAQLDQVTIDFCNVAVVPDGVAEMATYTRLCIQQCAYGIQPTTAASSYIIGNVDYSYAASGSFSTLLDIDDPGNVLYGDLRCAIVDGGVNLRTRGAGNINLRSINSVAYPGSLFPIATNDSFTRAANNLSLGQADSGQTWIVKEGGAWAINADAATCTAPAGGTNDLSIARISYLQPQLNQASYTITATIALGASGNQGGLLLAYADTGDFLFLYLEDAATGLYLQKVIAGVWENPTNAGYDAAYNPGTGSHVYKVTVTSTTITVAVDGSTEITYTMSAAEQTAFNDFASGGLVAYAAPGGMTWNAFSVV